LDEDESLPDESFGQSCVAEPFELPELFEPVDELVDESEDEVSEDVALLEPVDVAADVDAASACPTPTPPTRALVASVTARIARRIFGAIGASPPFGSVVTGTSEAPEPGNPRGGSRESGGNPGPMLGWSSARSQAAHSRPWVPSDA
jgi:hypothetical protein